MIKEFLESLRTPEHPLLGPNHWLIKKTGLRLPKGKLGKFLRVFFHGSLILFVITQYIELIFVCDDINSIIENLKSSSLSIVCAIKSASMLYWQDYWLEVLDYVTEADKFEQETRNQTRGVIVDWYTKQIKKITYYYVTLMLITNVAVLLPPILIYLSSSSYRAAVQNGTQAFPHVFSQWLPYDKNKFPLNWVTVGLQAFIGTMGTMIILSFDITAVVLMVFFGAKFDILRLRCEELLGETEVVSDEEFDRRVRLLHRIQTQLIQNIHLVKSLISPALFCYVVLAGLGFCASAFQFTIAESMGQKLMITEYLVFGLTQLFMFCWIGNEVLAKSSRLMWGPYACAWWRAGGREGGRAGRGVRAGRGARRRRAALLLAGQMRGEHAFSAGPFADLTLATFVGIIKGAYSFFTLLRN